MLAIIWKKQYFYLFARESLMNQFTNAALYYLAHMPSRLAQLPSRAIVSLSLWALLIVGPYMAGREGYYTGPTLQQASAPHAALASAPAATPSLPGGPKGGLLPPGALAPYGTFRNTYAWGNCTRYVASRRQIPNNWGHARTWLPRAQAAGWATGSTPAVGAIAWTSAGWYGHVAVVEEVDGNRVRVAEMNYRGLNVISTRWVPASSFRYIY